MRFLRSGETFDEYRKRTSSEFSRNDSYVVYGLGRFFRSFRDIFREELQIAAGIDHHANQIEESGFRVYTPDEFLKQDDGNAKIIILPQYNMYDEISSFLSLSGISSQRYISAFELMILWGMEYHRKLYIPEVNCFLTTACTLNCTACSQLTPYHRRAFTLSLSEVIENIDLCFRAADYVNDFILVGGETFLYPQLGDVLSYLSERYAKRFGEIHIFSNGTVVPGGGDAGSDAGNLAA